MAAFDKLGVHAFGDVGYNYSSAPDSYSFREVVMPALVFDKRRKEVIKMNVPKVGQVVKWHDSVGKEFDALVTAVWTPTCINVVIVSGNEAETDPYGRQIQRHTSQTHKSQQPVHGYYWRYTDEEPNPVVKPLAS